MSYDPKPDATKIIVVRGRLSEIKEEADFIALDPEGKTLKFVSHETGLTYTYPLSNVRSIEFI